MSLTTPLFLEDPYRKSADATVIALTEEGGIVLDQTVFYARGGGQPGDSGTLDWDGGRCEIASAVRETDGAIVLLPAEPTALPPVGTIVQQRLDWERRYGNMRMHTALHLLSVVLPFPVTGGAVGSEKARLDFLMPTPSSDQKVLEGELNAFVTRDLPVEASWISEADLEAMPELVKTMSVRPPTGAGQIRLVRIGPEERPVDLQPCGGTHVQRTSEIGKLKIAKIESKGRQNRRVTLEFA